MIEIIVIILLANKIKKMVAAKGLKPTKYIIFLVVLWLGLEFLFAIITILTLGPGPLAYIGALAGAVIGAVIAFQIAKNAEPAEESNAEILDDNLNQV